MRSNRPRTPRQRRCDHPHESAEPWHSGQPYCSKSLPPRDRTTSALQPVRRRLAGWRGSASAGLPGNPILHSRSSGDPAPNRSPSRSSRTGAGWQAPSRSALLPARAGMLARYRAHRKSECTRCGEPRAGCWREKTDRFFRARRPGHRGLQRYRTPSRSSTGTTRRTCRPGRSPTGTPRCRAGRNRRLGR